VPTIPSSFSRPHCADDSISTAAPLRRFLAEDRHPACPERSRGKRCHRLEGPRPLQEPLTRLIASRYHSINRTPQLTHSKNLPAVRDFSRKSFRCNTCAILASHSKHVTLTPLDATLTRYPLAKSFRCHSYANRGVGGRVAHSPYLRFFGFASDLAFINPSTLKAFNTSTCLALLNPSTLQPLNPSALNLVHSS
jgi:hypothetical protein